MQKAFNVNAAHETYNMWMLELSVYDDDNTVYINKVTEKEEWEKMHFKINGGCMR